MYGLRHCCPHGARASFEPDFCAGAEPTPGKRSEPISSGNHMPLKCPRFRVSWNSNRTTIIPLGFQFLGHSFPKATEFSPAGSSSSSEREYRRKSSSFTAELLRRSLPRAGHHFFFSFSCVACRAPSVPRAGLSIAWLDS